LATGVVVKPGRFCFPVVSLPAGVSRALACAMRPPMSAVPEQPAPHSEASPHVNNLYGQNT
jgi:hypothetical protein